MRWRILAGTVFLICSAVASRAGGPAFVAGSGYNPGVEGQPMIWANGAVEYFTDQGDLSPILTNAQADTLVAGAFSAWTSISGVALTAAQGGHLAEDVNGSNVTVDATATITAPADITSSATGTPVGIVYDFDGTVTNTLLGQGAGDPADCFTNAVYGGPDNFSAGGNIAHALVVINGVCAATNAQLPDVQYRLVRVLGRILGLGWSQANVNVLTHHPAPTSADVAGFPVMHFTDPINCVPIAVCYANAAVPKMDDGNALARLYPATVNPQPAGRIYGNLYFTDASGNAAQPMQGVNVVARLMVSNQPSRQYVVTSVSGFAFHGNAGNIVNGYLDANGLRYDRWGSNDPSVEGFFDLGQLTIPTGQTIAQYQLTVEVAGCELVDGCRTVCPHPGDALGFVRTGCCHGDEWVKHRARHLDVAGCDRRNASRQRVILCNPGNTSRRRCVGVVDLRLRRQRLVRIQGAGEPDGVGRRDRSRRSGPAGGNQTPARHRNLAIERPERQPSARIHALGIQHDDLGNDPSGCTVRVADTYRVGVADFRGDGRPDYFYHASLLYSDTVTPARLSLAGGVTTLNGTGFKPGLQVTAAGNNGNTLSASASQIQVAMPATTQDGTATIQVTDPAGGAFSQMTGALTYGALATDRLLLLQGAEPATPVGSAAANPIRVRAVAADGVTPVSGATIAWSATNGLQFSACSGASSCSVLTDEAGESSSAVTPTATGASTITIALAPASYSPPQSQQATVVGTSTALDLAAVIPTRWIGQGATLAVPLTVEALDLGVPQANVGVNFAVTKGTASLSASSATTNSSGFATIQAQITNQSADVQVSACVAPNNSPCQTFTMFSTPPSLWTLETVSGSSQVVPVGQAFQPLVMRVTDGSSVANPVMGVNVTFQTTLARVPESGMPVILGSSAAQVVSAQDGLASMVPSVGSVGPCDVFIAVSAGSSSAQLQMETVAAIVVAQSTNSGGNARSDWPGLHFSWPAGSQASSSLSPGVPGLLFAVPELISLDDSAASHSPCSGTCPETSSMDSSAGADGTAGAVDASPDLVGRPLSPAPELPKVDGPPVSTDPAEPSIKAIGPSCR